MNKITVVGYGSLLAISSARETVPALENFRVISVPGYRRVFNKVGVVFFERYSIEAGDLNIASCSTRADKDGVIICSAFDISEEDFLGIYEREHRFKWVEVNWEEHDGRSFKGRMCSEYNDLEYRLNKCVTESDYHQRVGQHYSGQIWRDDIFPYPTYLNHCITAAESLGKHVLDNFLDSTYLADGITPLRAYLTENPLPSSLGVYSSEEK